MEPAKASLEELIARAKTIWDAMSSEQRAQVLRNQAECWAKAEAQWAKDFREGKCERD